MHFDAFHLSAKSDHREGVVGQTRADERFAPVALPTPGQHNESLPPRANLSTRSRADSSHAYSSRHCHMIGFNNRDVQKERKREPICPWPKTLSLTKKRWQHEVVCPLLQQSSLDDERRTRKDAACCRCRKSKTKHQPFSTAIIRCVVEFGSPARALLSLMLPMSKTKG